MSFYQQQQPSANHLNVRHLYVACKHAIPYRGSNYWYSSLSWLVRKWNSGYTHCEFAMKLSDVGNDNFYTFSVEMNEPLECYNRSYRDGTWDLYEIHCSQDQKNGIYEWCISQIGKPMNKWGFFLNFIPFLSSCYTYDAQQNAFFCSEFVMHGLKLHLPQFANVIPCKSNPQSVKTAMESGTASGFCLMTMAADPDDFGTLSITLG